MTARKFVTSLTPYAKKRIRGSILTFLGLSALVVAAFMFMPLVGWVALGLSCFVLDYTLDES